jgi:hypothetical protein
MDEAIDGLLTELDALGIIVKEERGEVSVRPTATAGASRPPEATQGCSGAGRLGAGWTGEAGQSN